MACGIRLFLFFLSFFTLLSAYAAELNYSTTVFPESQQNNGMVDNSTPATITLSGDTFAANLNEELTMTGKVNVTNLPVGMTASIMKRSDTTATVEIWGSAFPHANVNDVNNLTIAFQNSAFAGGNAASVTNSTKNDLKIDFFGITVMNGNDSGPGSLRQIIADAEVEDIIDFAPDVTSITLNSEITIGKSITIDAEDPERVTISGNNTTRIFKVSGTGTLDIELTSLTLQNGHADKGGAIYIDGADSSDKTVYIENCIIKNNKATQHGGAIFADAPASSTTNLAIACTTISGNTAEGTTSPVAGGAIYVTTHSGTMAEPCLLSVAVIQSTITGNLAKSTSGTCDVKGGGIYLTNSSTFALAPLFMFNSTVASNQALNTGLASKGVCGGIYLANGDGYTIDTNYSATFHSSIIANNTCSATPSATIGPDITKSAAPAPTVASASSYNLIGTSTGSHGLTNGVNNNMVTAITGLQTLADNGGDTPTMALDGTSNAKDKGSAVPLQTFISQDRDGDGKPDFDMVIDTDQRGYGYTRTYGSAPDIGAFEWIDPALTHTVTFTAGEGGTITGTTPQTINHGQLISGNVTAVPNSGYTFRNWTGTNFYSPTNPLTPLIVDEVVADMSINANFDVNNYVLTFTADPHGSINGPTPQIIQHGGNAGEIRADAAEGWHFANWTIVETGAEFSTDNPLTVTNVTSGKNLLANFAINTYAVTYSAGSDGSLTGELSQQVVHGQSSTPVTAKANTGYHFVNWSDGSPANPRFDSNITGDITVTANFAANDITSGLVAYYPFNGNANDESGNGNDGTPHDVTAAADLFNEAGKAYAFGDGKYIEVPDAPSLNPANQITICAWIKVNSYLHENSPIVKKEDSVPAQGYTLEFLNDSIRMSLDGIGVLTNSVPVSTGSWHFVVAFYDGSRANVFVDGVGAEWVNGTGAIPVSSSPLNIGRDMHRARYFDGLIDEVRIYDRALYAEEIMQIANTPGRFTITASAGANGSIFPPGEITVKEASTRTYTIVPDYANHYHLAELLVDGEAVIPPVTSYDFTNITANHTIAASFALDTFTLAYAAGTGGTISGTASQTIGWNLNGTEVEAVPNEGYHFTNWSDGVLTAKRTETAVDHEINVTANFAINQYALSYAAGANGTLAGTESQLVDHGSNGTPVTAVADSGYHFTGWSDGVLTASRTETGVTHPITVTAGFALNDINTGLVAYYPLNGNPNDMSGNGNHGTLSGVSPATDHLGVPGKAYSFGEVNYIRIPDAPELNPSAQITICAWVKLNSVGGCPPILKKCDGRYGPTFSLEFMHLDNKARLVIGDTTPEGSLASNEMTVPLGEWHFVCGVYDGTKANTYVDGVGAEWVFKSIPIPALTEALFIGHDLFNNRWIDGSIDEVRMYNRALYPEEIQTLYGSSYHVIAASAGPNGSISPSGPVNVLEGTDKSFSISANTGYHIEDVLVDSSTVGTVSNHDFTNVTASHSISATFSINQYAVTYFSGGNGTISGTASQTVDHGSDATAVTANPAPGYHFVNWSDASTVNPRTDTNVTAPISVTANFAANDIVSDLVLYYPFSGNANDASASENHGTVTGATLSTDRFGNADSAYSFDGAANYITSQKDGPLNTYGRTISVWAKTASTAEMDMLQYGAEGNGVRTECSLNWNGSEGVSFDIYNGAFTRTATLADSAWHHYVYVIDQDPTSLPDVKIYMDGILLTENATTVRYDSSLSPTQSQISVGYLPGYGRYFSGHLDEIRIYTRPFYGPEVAELYSAEKTYTVRFVAGANGTTEGTATQTLPLNGDCSAVRANPALGFHLVNWTGTNGFVTTEDNPLTVTGVNKDMTITANFAINIYPVTFTAGANGSITGTASQLIEHGSNSTEVTALPDSGFQFLGWTGSLTSTANPLTLTNITGNISLTANFARTTLGNGSVNEHQASGTLVGTLSTIHSDAGESVTYSLVGGDGSSDNALFSIDGDSLKTAAVLDYETKDTLSIRVRMTDGDALWLEKNFTVTVGNVAESAITLPFRDDFTDGKLVPDSWKINNQDKNSYSLTNTPGCLQLSTTSTDTWLGTNSLANLFYVTLPPSADNYVMTSKITLAQEPYQEWQQAGIIALADNGGGLPNYDTCLRWDYVMQPGGGANNIFGDLLEIDCSHPEAPAGTLRHGTVDNNPFWLRIVKHGTSYQMYSSLDGSDFMLNRIWTWGSEVRHLGVFALHGHGLSADPLPANFDWFEVRSASTDIALSSKLVEEKKASGTAVGTFSTSCADGGNTYAYSLVSGTGSGDNASFTIDGDGLKTAESFNYLVKSSYSIRVRTTDQGGVPFEKQFTILIVPAPLAVPDGLVSCWKAEENAKDSVGDNHGAAINGATYANGRIGRAFSLDGNDDAIRVPDSASLHVTSFTIEAWISPAADVYMPIVEWNNETGVSPSFGPQIWCMPGGKLFGNVCERGETYFETGGGILAPGQWSHVALTYDRDSGIAKMYVNGVGAQQKNVDPAYAPVINTDFPLFIGRRPSSHNGPQEIMSFNGLIDEVSLYGRALSAAEIGDLSRQVPDAFSFTAQTGMPLSTVIVSGPVTISGTTLRSAISVTGGEYAMSTNGGLSWSAWTDISGLINPDSMVMLRQTSSGSNLTMTTAILTVGGVSASFNVTTAATGDPNSNGLVSWWKAEDNVLDSIGGQHGTMKGDAGFSAGQSGEAFSFDGASDYVEMPAGVGDFTNDPFTVEFWFRSNTALNSSEAYLMGKSHPDGGQGWDIRLYNQTIKVCGVNGWGFNIISDASATANVWHHIALSASGSDVNLYIDGILKGTSARAGISPTANPFRIGFDTNYGGEAFNGLIDEVKIYARALAPNEVGILSGQVPDAFSFIAQTGVPKNTGIVSNAITVTGISYPAGISVTGGEYAISTNGGASWGEWTSSQGTVSENSQVKLRLTSSASYSTTTTASLIIGGVGASFNATTVSGGPGNCAQFTAGSNSFMAAANSTELNPVTALTIEAWIKPVSGGGEWTLILGKQYNPGDNNPWYTYRFLAASANSGEKGFPRRISFNVAPLNSGGEVGVASTTVVPVDTWTHVAGVYDGTALKIYINGIFENSIPQTGNLRVSDLPLYIGKAPWTNYNNYNGQMDEIRIWNVARTESQIRYAMKRSLMGNEEGLVAYYPFNDPPGSGTADDASLYNNIATLYNGAAIVSDSTAPNSLVSWWRAEGNAADSIGLNHGTLLNGTTFTSGITGQTFNFDGVDDAVKVPAAASLQVNSFTLAGWIRPAVNGIAMPLAEWNKELGVSPLFGPNLWCTSDGRLSGNITAMGDDAVQSPPGLIAAGNWTHVAFTYDVAGGISAVYVNGTQQGTKNVGTPTLYTGYPLFIGRRPASHNGPQEVISFNGGIDEFEIHNRALSAAEILNLYEQIDTTPDAFTFAAQTGMPLSTAVVSNPITVTGINCPASVEISGGTYSISLNGGSSWSPWTNASGTVSLDTLVKVRLTSSSSNSSLTSATLSIGGVSAEFKVTTAKADDPNAYGLVAWWRAEDNALDSVGLNNGTPHGGVSFAAGNDGRAFNLDGANGSRISVPDSPDLDITGDLTVTTWIKRDAPGQGRYEHLLNKGAAVIGGIDVPSSYVMQFPGDDRLTAGFERNDGSNALLYGAPITDTNFHHLAYVRSGNEHSLYIDGQMVSSELFSGTPGGTAGLELTVGACNDDSGFIEAFKGRMDEIKIFNRALSAEEIVNVAGPLPAIPSLRLWLKADAGVAKDGSGLVSKWADMSGYGFDVAQGDSARQPLLAENACNNLPAIRFDGDNDYLQTSGAINLLQGTSNYSLFVVTKPGSTQKTHADIVDYQHYENTSYVLQQHVDDTNQFGLTHWQPLTANTYQMLSGIYVNNTSYTSYLNGINRMQTSGFITISCPEPRYFTVGNKSLEQEPRQFNGDVAEVIVYNSPLSDAERQKVENYLIAKYGIDTVPDAFTFTDQSGVPPNTPTVSNSRTVTGIGYMAAIRIVGGQYQINGGTWTSDDGTVRLNDTVKVRVTSAATSNTTVNATLTIGGISDTFSVTTGYVLKYTAGPNGSITGAPDQVVLPGGNGSEVAADPDENCFFMGWSDGVLTYARQDTNVQSDINVTANFLANGTVIENISLDRGQEGYYQILGFSGQTFLKVDLSGFEGDCDMYIMYGEKPTRQMYHAKSTNPSNNDESFTIYDNLDGDWYVLLHAYEGFSGANLSFTYGTDKIGLPGALAASTDRADRIRISWNGVPNATAYELWRGATDSMNLAVKIADVADTAESSFSHDDMLPAGSAFHYWVKAKTDTVESGFAGPVQGFTVNPYFLKSGTAALVSGKAGSMATYSITVPDALQTLLEITVTGGTGDCDFDVVDPDGVTVKRVVGGGNAGIAQIAKPAQGTWRIYVYGITDYTGVSVLAKYSRQTAAPLAPAGVNASDGLFPDRITVTWTASPGATSYVVGRKNNITDAGFSAEIETTDCIFEDNSADVLNAPSGKLFYYSVKARNAVDYGKYSAANSGYRSKLPAAPTAVTASNGTCFDKILVTWPKVADATSYELYRSPTSPAKTITRADSLNPCVITATGHGFETGDEVLINGIAATGTIATLLNGKSFAITKISDNTFSVPVNTIGKTYVSGGTAISAKPLATIPYDSRLTTYSYNDTADGSDPDPNPASTYYYWVSAVNASGAGPLKISGTVGSIKKTGPTTVAATAGTLFGKIKITWTAVPGATGYDVYRYADKDCKTVPNIFPAGANLYYEDTDAPVGTSAAPYYYRVKAKYKTYYESWFNLTAAAGYHKITSGPATISASAGTLFGKVRVKWSAVAGADSYELFRDDFRIPITKGATTYDDVPGDTLPHFYKVIAKSGTQASNPSVTVKGWAYNGTGISNLATPTLKASKDLYTTVQLSWTEIPLAENYKIYRNTIPTFDQTKLLATETQLAYEDKAASPGVLYYYWIQAKNDTIPTTSLKNATPAQGRALPEATEVFSGDLKICSGAKDSRINYFIDIPPGTTRLVVKLAETSSAATNDCDVYARFGSYPSTTSYNAKGVENATGEILTVTNPTAGKWYLMLYGVSLPDYANVTMKVDCYSVTDIILTQVPSNGLAVPFTANFKGRVVDESATTGIKDLSIQVRNPLTGVTSWLPAKTDVSGYFTYSALINTEGEHTFDFFFTEIPDLAKGTASHTVATRKGCLEPNSFFDFSAYIPATPAPLAQADVIGLQHFLNIRNGWNEGIIDTVKYEPMWINSTIVAASTDAVLLGKLDEGLHMFLYGVEGAGVGNDTTAKSALSTVPFVVHVSAGKRDAVLKNLKALEIIDQTQHDDIRNNGRIGVVTVAAFSNPGEGATEGDKNISLLAKEQLELLAKLAAGTAVFVEDGKYSDATTKMLTLTLANGRTINVIAATFVR